MWHSQDGVLIRVGGWPSLRRGTRVHSKYDWNPGELLSGDKFVVSISLKAYDAPANYINRKLLHFWKIWLREVWYSPEMWLRRQDHEESFPHSTIHADSRIGGRNGIYQRKRRWDSWASWTLWQCRAGWDRCRAGWDRWELAVHYPRGQFEFPKQCKLFFPTFFRFFARFPKSGVDGS